MNSIDTTSNGFYHNATQTVQSQIASDTARRKEKEQGVKKPLFSSLVQKNLEQNSLTAAGLPAEIAGMSQEEAIVFLKDQLDIAGDELSKFGSGESFEKYKKAVGQFVRYIEKNNYTLEEHKRPGFRRGKKREPLVLIQAINQKLDRLAYDIWYNHLDKFKLLEKIHEINGLVIDLSAV